MFLSSFSFQKWSLASTIYFASFTTPTFISFSCTFGRFLYFIFLHSSPAFHLGLPFTNGSHFSQFHVLRNFTNHLFLYKPPEECRALHLFHFLIVLSSSDLHFYSFLLCLSQLHDSSISVCTSSLRPAERFFYFKRPFFSSLSSFPDSQSLPATNTTVACSIFFCALGKISKTAFPFVFAKKERTATAASPRGGVLPILAFTAPP